MEEAAETTEARIQYNNIQYNTSACSSLKLRSAHAITRQNVAGTEQSRAKDLLKFHTLLVGPTLSTIAAKANNTNKSEPTPLMNTY